MKRVRKLEGGSRGKVKVVLQHEALGESGKLKDPLVLLVGTEPQNRQKEKKNA